MIREKTIFRNILFGAALLVAGASAMALSSCTEKEMSAEPAADGSEVEICFTPSLGNGAVTKSMDVQPLGDSELFLTTIVSDNTSNPIAGAMTRATEITGFDPNGTDGTTYDSFGVYSFLHEGSWGSSTTVTPYINGLNVVSNGDGTWGFEESVFWPAWDTNMTFFGYAPVSVVVGDGETVDANPYIDFTDPAVPSGTTDELDLSKQYDLLVAKTADVTKSSSSVSMKFAHALTAVRFICGEIYAVGTITKIGLSNVKYSGVYDMSAGTWTLTDDTYDYEITTLVAVSGVDADGEYIDKGSAILAGEATLMMLPQTLSGTVLTVEFTAEDGVTTYTVELSTEWAAGAEVTYSISLADDRIDIIPYLTTDMFKNYCLENYSSDGEHVWYPTETRGVTTMDFKNSTSSYAGVTKLEYVDLCWFENLTHFTSQTVETLDVSGNLELNHINLGGTDAITDPGAPIDTLDLSNNTKMTEIYTAAFAYCAKLTSITFPSSLTKIDFDAFEYCTSLASVNIPASVTEIGGDAFEGCTSLATATFNSEVTLDGRSFADCTGLTSVVNSEYVLFSGKSAGNFQSCSSLTYFKLNEKVTALEAEEFYYSGLTELVGIEQLISIGNYALAYTGITSAALHEGMTTIGEHAFYYCQSLTGEINFPSTLTTIGKEAFSHTAITSVVFDPDKIHEGAVTIGSSVFSNCTSLKSVSLPDGWTEIGQSWFSNCSALTSITLPSTITTIDQGAFSACSSFTTIDLPDGLTFLGDQAFQTCSKLTEITIPSGVSVIGYYAFTNASALDTVDLPAVITSIGKGQTHSSSGYAFSGCTHLSKMIIRATSVPTLNGSNNFGSQSSSSSTSRVPSSCVIYVPDDSVSTYEAAWGSEGSGYFTTFKGLSDLHTDFPDDYDDKGDRITGTAEP